MLLRTQWCASLCIAQDVGHTEAALFLMHLSKKSISLNLTEYKLLAKYQLKSNKMAALHLSNHFFLALQQSKLTLTTLCCIFVFPQVRFHLLAALLFRNETFLCILH